MRTPQQKGMKSGIHSPQQKMERAQRDAEIVRLRQSGMSTVEIGKRFGLTNPRITQIYNEALRQAISNEEIAIMRTEQAQRLDALLVDAHTVLRRTLLAHEDVQALAAIQTVLRIEERRAKLFGLDAPQRTEISVEQVRYEIIGVDKALIA